MAEIKTIRKWFWVWDFEKEERWLNDMAESGWALVSVGFCRYSFERCEPGEYIVRLEAHGFDEGYVSFMEETGAEFVGRYFRWIYFRRKSELGPFDIFSDIDSKIEHLKGIARMLAIIGGANLVIGVANARYSPANLLCATLLMYGLGRIHEKTEQLKRERELHE